MTKPFSKWVSNQNIVENGLSEAISEVQLGLFEANLRGHLYKKRIAFEGQGKSGSGRTIICYKKMTEQFLFMGFLKMKNQIYQKKNLQYLKSFLKFC